MRRTAMMAMAAMAAVVGSVLAQETNRPPLPATPRDDKDKAVAQAANPKVVIETSMGTIKAELWPDKAPATVKSFLAYADDKFYDATIFHRVIDGFMIQGGGMDASMQQKPTKAPVKNEARTDVPNERGTLAMARTMVVDSATAQFFINLVNNGFLNHSDETARGFGYCVFGKVTEGMDVVDKIGKVATGARGKDVPNETVTIKSVRRAE
jgi:cyclophilin family peptidyl-prolyl cis-trans isomerase